MSRSTDEWIGKTDDSAVPPRVRVRRFDAFGGICYLSHRKIRAGEKWELHHIIALINGGQHRESNLAPVLYDAHKKQTRLDVAEKKLFARKRAKYIGATRPKRAFQSKFKKKVSGEVVLR